jgi:hypothetical protein
MWRVPRRRPAHFIVTIEGWVLFVLALLAFGGVAQRGVSFVPLACAVPFLVTAAKRPWIGAGDVLRTRAYVIPYFRRIKLDEVAIFELVAPREQNWTPGGMYGVRARMADGRTMQVQESSSMRRTGALEWQSSLNGLLELRRGAPPAPWVPQARTAGRLDDAWPAER